MKDKATSVRILTAQYDELQELADALGGSVNGLVRKAVANYLECEAPVWLEAAQNARKKLKLSR